MKLLPAGARTGIVAGGYAAALALAFCVVLVYISRTSGPDRDTYAAMYAFGDAQCGDDDSRSGCGRLSLALR